jgi:tetratricopeptide (TPR) repeat protein
MPRKKKMFKELHERWKELDLPEEQEDLLDRIEKDFTGSEKKYVFKEFVNKLRTDLKDSELWFKLGSALLEENKYEFALATFDITSKVDQTNWNLWAIKGFIQIKLGKKEEARESLLRALEQTDTFGDVENVDVLIEDIESGKIKLLAFATPLREGEEVGEEISRIESKLESMIMEGQEAPSKHELEGELEALSDELEKILQEDEEEEPEVYRCPECGDEIEHDAVWNFLTWKKFPRGWILMILKKNSNAQIVGHF